MREKELLVFVLAAALSTSVFGCKPNSVDQHTDVVLVSVSITPPGAGIAPGTMVQFTAIGTYSNHTTKNLTTAAVWGSSDPAVATISNLPGSQGLALASMATGSTLISAAYGSITGSTTLTTSPVASIALAPATPPSIAPGTTRQFIASATLENGAMQDLTTWATWTSTDSAIATVGDASGFKGLATAISAPGAAAIEAIFGGISGSTILTTSAVLATEVTPSAASIAKGTTQQFDAAGHLSDGTLQALTSWATWTSSNPAAATVSNAPGKQGLATSLAVGTAAITASFSGISSYATLTISPAVVTSISTTPTNTNVPLGESVQFTATGTFTDGTTQNITSSVSWNSSNTAIATISNSSGSRGLATTAGEGSCTISASLSGITSNFATLTVSQPVLDSIIVTPLSSSITVGWMQQFTATGVYSDGSTQDLTTTVSWKSSDGNVATINNTGLAIAAFYPGSCSISATLSGITSNAASLTVHY